MDLRNPPIWLGKLALSSERPLRVLYPAPSEGILNTCRLSDEVLIFSRACFNAQHSHLNPTEQLCAFAERRDAVRYARDRVFSQSQ